MRHNFHKLVMMRHFECLENGGIFFLPDVIIRIIVAMFRTLSCLNRKMETKLHTAAATIATKVRHSNTWTVWYHPEKRVKSLKFMTIFHLIIFFLIGKIKYIVASNHMSISMKCDYKTTGYSKLKTNVHFTKGITEKRILQNRFFAINIFVSDYRLVECVCRLI